MERIDGPLKSQKAAPFKVSVPQQWIKSGLIFRNSLAAARRWGHLPKSKLDVILDDGIL
jgi:hypothetical protein